MHSAIFTITEIPEQMVGDTSYYESLKTQANPPDVAALLAHMAGTADMVRSNEESQNWELDNLLDAIKNWPQMEISDGERMIFSFPKDGSYIKQELKRRLHAAEEILEDEEYQSILHYKVLNIINDTKDYYLNIVDAVGSTISFSTFDRFMLSSFNLGKTYMIIFVNDYHY